MLTPEEIQKEFEEFVKNRFGGQVHVVTQKVDMDLMDELEVTAKHEPVLHESKAVNDDRFHFEWTPRQIKAKLDQFVIRQDEAKKVLSIAVCDHYNRVKACQTGLVEAGVDYNKQNVLLLGPTGVGKTYLVRQIAKLIGVPFVKADATRFSETGYVGANVDDLIHDLVNQANGDLELAQYGIIYLDEADKLAGSHHQQSRDVNGRGVQFALLKLMEETDVDLRSGNDIRAQMQAFMDMQRRGKPEPKVVNTRHILFILSGAFTGLQDLIEERLQQRTIGFSRETAVTNKVELLQKAETVDFIKFGFEPEFVGRLPVRVSCVNLLAEDLYLVLKEAKGSVVKQYQDSFAAYGIALEFTDNALMQIAEKAALEKTGARGLMTICEGLLRDFKFELPSLDVKALLVDEDLVADPAASLRKIIATAVVRNDTDYVH